MPKEKDVTLEKPLALAGGDGRPLVRGGRRARGAIFLFLGRWFFRVCLA